jgi:hypothetical protein
LFEQGPVRRFIRERRERLRGVRGFHQQLPTTRDYWASLITDEEKAEVEYRRLSDMMAPGGPLEVATWVREIVWGMAEDEKRHARQLQDILKFLEKEGKIV